MNRPYDSSIHLFRPFQAKIDSLIVAHPLQRDQWIIITHKTLPTILFIFFPSQLEAWMNSLVKFYIENE
jgi:hypothetical protein